ncbi:hypothetical protein LQ564_22780 [Massilia sp. G4R7]|uniref:Uncharacterized protein n=1 Tax=Massilia phyllostachyos TaxID=2898585 RepID=A0ABS8QBK9_9BURK|nr:hypothetical protein [Massilia phyllostachyos]MCD2519132.1 hypothetical protein [Massilia phyllostachyos]
MRIVQRLLLVGRSVVPCSLPRRPVSGGFRRGQTRPLRPARDARAARIGARLRIDSDDGGITVTLAIPLEPGYTTALRA